MMVNNSVFSSFSSTAPSCKDSSLLISYSLPTEDDDLEAGGVLFPQVATMVIDDDVLKDDDAQTYHHCSSAIADGVTDGATVLGTSVHPVIVWVVDEDDSAHGPFVSDMEVRFLEAEEIDNAEGYNLASASGESIHDVPISILIWLLRFVAVLLGAMFHFLSLYYEDALATSDYGNPYHPLQWTFRYLETYAQMLVWTVIQAIFAYYRSQQQNSSTTGLTATPRRNKNTCRWLLTILYEVSRISFIVCCVRLIMIDVFGMRLYKSTNGLLGIRPWIAIIDIVVCGLVGVCVSLLLHHKRKD